MPRLGMMKLFLIFGVGFVSLQLVAPGSWNSACSAEHAESASCLLMQVKKGFQLNRRSTNMTEQERFDYMVRACSSTLHSDLSSDAVLFSGLWVLKQLGQDSFSKFGLPLAEQLVARYSTSSLVSGHASSLAKTLAAGECDKLLEKDNKLAVVDLWFFTQVPGGFGPPVVKPPDTWRHCAQKFVGDWSRRLASTKSPVSPEDAITNFIFAMEMHELASTASNAAALSLAELDPATKLLLTDAETVFAAMDSRWLMAESECSLEPLYCGYYLTHRALQLTSFFSRKLADADKPLARDIGKALRERIGGYLVHRAGKGQRFESEQDVDLAGEVVLTFLHVIFQAAPPACEDVNLVKKLQAMVRAADIPQSCHPAVVQYFTVGPQANLEVQPMDC